MVVTKWRHRFFDTMAYEDDLRHLEKGLIDCKRFNAVSAIFQPCNGGRCAGRRKLCMDKCGVRLIKQKTMLTGMRWH